MNPSESSSSPELHFCALVHGLWGNPKHLSHLASELRKTHAEELLHILIPKSNSGNNTYDGIELGAERVAAEIEDEITKLKKSGKKITKFSITGYSIGGLVARYTIGILYSRKLFDELTPINFTTIATPHLGVRTPMMGWHSQMWNSLGSRTLSSSGQQIFLVDNFRNTDRPLLSILADPDSTFMHALSLFKNRSLYANIINDRSVPFYTAYIAKTDPFVNIDAIDINYDSEYEDVILETDMPVRPRQGERSFYETFVDNTRYYIHKSPYYLWVGLVLPLGATAFLINAGVQSYRSAQRIKDHEGGESGISVKDFRFPLIETVQKSTDAAFEHLNALKEEEYQDERESGGKRDTAENKVQKVYIPEPEKTAEAAANLAATAADSEAAGQPFEAGFPTLALTAEQFKMIDSLNGAGFKKYPVHIKKVNHSHAAIIVRKSRESFSEGNLVSRHWIERFEI